MVVFLVGCVAAGETEPAPSVVLVRDPVPVPHEWEALGFSFGDAGLDECTQAWYKFDELPCQITIGIVRVPMLRERSGTSARTFRDLRRVEIDSRLEGSDLEVAIAHEVGHVLLDTPEHTANGIMSGKTAVLSKDDRALACRTIGLGC